MLFINLHWWGGWMEVFGPILLWVWRPACAFPPLFAFPVYSVQEAFWAEHKVLFLVIGFCSVLEEDRAMLWNAGKSHPDDREGGSGASTGKLTPFAAIAAPCSRQYFWTCHHHVLPNAVHWSNGVKSLRFPCSSDWFWIVFTDHQSIAKNARLLLKDGSPNAALTLHNRDITDTFSTKTMSAQKLASFYRMGAPPYCPTECLLGAPRSLPYTRKSTRQDHNHQKHQ